MARFKVTGLDSYLNALERIASPVEIREYMGRAIYDGAKVVANNTKTALEGLTPDDSTRPPNRRRSINTIQKKGLIDSYGIAPARFDGTFLNVKVGFDGYNNLITPRWPQGQPNVVIARSLESGTSFMDKNPIISKTERASEGDCIEAMQKSLNQAYEKLMK